MNLLYKVIHTVFNFILQKEQSIDLQFKFRGIHLLVESPFYDSYPLKRRNDNQSQSFNWLPKFSGV